MPCDAMVCPSFALLLIDDERLNEVLRGGDYLEATQEILHRHGGLWFQDESFVVVRKS